ERDGSARQVGLPHAGELLVQMGVVRPHTSELQDVQSARRASRLIPAGLGYRFAVAEVQITSWRELPSLVVARDGTSEAKVPLPPRFQEAIDEAAMRLGEVSSEAYLDGWRRSPWTPGAGTPGELAAETAERLERE